MPAAGRFIFGREIILLFDSSEEQSCDLSGAGGDDCGGGSGILSICGSRRAGYDLAESNKPWEDYQDYGHNHWHNSLIWGEGLERRFDLRARG